MKIQIFTLVVLVALIGCKKDEDPEPVAAEKQGTLFAGANNQSKSWKLTGGTAQETGSGTETFSFDACFLDNVYKFSNNDSQTYENTEGSTKCTDTDPTNIESGSWAFTIDGKIVIVVANEINNFDQSLFGALASPANIITLTATDLEIEYEFAEVTYNFTFKAI